MVRQQVVAPNYGDYYYPDQRFEYVVDAGGTDEILASERPIQQYLQGRSTEESKVNDDHHLFWSNEATPIGFITYRETFIEQKRWGCTASANNSQHRRPGL